MTKVQLLKTLENSSKIDFSTYEKSHKKRTKKICKTQKKQWILDRVETEIPASIGARFYKLID